MVTVTCRGCGKRFEAARATRSTCSPACKQRVHRARRAEATDTTAARRRQDRDRKRAERARAPARQPPAPATWVDWFRARFPEVLDWELDWLGGVLESDRLYGALSMPRANGKTSWLGCVAAAAVAPDGPLFQAGTATVLVAASFDQARELHGAARDVLQPYVDGDPEGWRMLDSQRLLIEHRETRTRLEVRAAEPRTLHGVRNGRLFILDEPAQMQRSAADKIWAAIRTSAGKVAGCRVLVCGTRPATADHWFARLLEGGPATHVTTFAAGEADDPFDPSVWAAVNPSWEALPELRRVVAIEAEEARRDPSLLPGFRSLRLNTGEEDHEVAHLLEADTWAAAECDVLPEIAPPYVLGVDLGGTAAMSAAAAFGLEGGALESFAMFSSAPDLGERSRRDGVGDLYERMRERGELEVVGGMVVEPAALLQAAVQRWGPPGVVVCDRYREAELLQAIFDSGMQIPVVVRGMGWVDGSADVRAFQRAVLAGRVHAEVSLLLRSAMREARTVADPSGNRKLAKGSAGGRRALARDDAAAAAVLAVAHASRIEPPRPLRMLIA